MDFNIPGVKPLCPDDAVFLGVRRHIGVPWRMSASDCRVRQAAPRHEPREGASYSELLGLLVLADRRAIPMDK